MAWASGINHWAFPDTSVREAAALTKQAGCDLIELNLAETGEVSLTTTAAEAQVLRRCVADAGLQISSLSTALYWRYSPTAEDSHIRQQAQEIARRQLALAADLGAATILVVPGLVGRQSGGPVVDYAVAYERAQEFLTLLSPEAEQAGVQLAIENVWNKFLLSPLEMRDLVDAVGGTHVGVYFDVGNILASGYPEQWITILGPRIRAIHLKDYRYDPPGFVDLGAGDVNWPAVGAALRQIGYQGGLVAEVIPTAEEAADLSGYAARLAQGLQVVLAQIARPA